MNDDAEIIGGLAEGERELRTARRESRARSYTIEGAISGTRYALPIHFADDVTVTGVAHKLRVGTCSVDLFLHDDESFARTYAVTTTNTPVFDDFAEDLEAGELLRIQPYSPTGGAADLTFTLFFT